MGNTDFYLMKINSAGKFLWERTFGDVNIENAFSIQQTNDSGFVICGYTNSFGNGGYDTYLVKTDSLGNFQWGKAYGGSDWDFGYWAEQTNDGGYILCGETFSYGNSNQAYLVKTNSNGDSLWTKNFGSTGIEIAKEVHQTNDAGFVFAGQTTSDTGGIDAYLVKTDSNGNLLWEKSFGNSADNTANAIAITSDKKFLLGGYSYVGTEKKNYFIKTDSAGSLLNLVIDSGGSGNREIYRIRENKEGDYFIAGWLDAISGNAKEFSFSKWNSGFWFLTGGTAGGPYDEEAYDIVETSDSGYAIVGYTGTFGVGVDNILILRTNKNMSYTNTVNSYVSTNELAEAEENISVYPNPFCENLFISLNPGVFSNEKKIMIAISDLTGKEIISEEKEILPQQISIKIPSGKFNSGIYFLNISSKEKSFHKKLTFFSH
jgi:hypothetical protein